MSVQSWVSDLQGHLTDPFFPALLNQIHNCCCLCKSNWRTSNCNAMQLSTKKDWKSMRAGLTLTNQIPSSKGPHLTTIEKGEAAPSSTSKGTIEHGGDGGDGSTEATPSRYESQ
ncbi:hypothetical protein Fot_12161 [Forsythia ovata]|uniref:Uncharacterized protein n=1 Tax=Forsythia ovata TaxID=205694 RepID=A0ABD1WLR6_9LAMI